jgi:hypothetical protein
MILTETDRNTGRKKVLQFHFVQTKIKTHEYWPGIEPEPLPAVK